MAVAVTGCAGREGCGCARSRDSSRSVTVSQAWREARRGGPRNAAIAHSRSVRRAHCDSARWRVVSRRAGLELSGAAAIRGCRQLKTAASTVLRHVLTCDCVLQRWATMRTNPSMLPTTAISPTHHYPTHTLCAIKAARPSSHPPPHPPLHPPHPRPPPRPAWPPRPSTWPAEHTCRGYTSRAPAPAPA